MKTITDTELKEILRLHSLWLQDDPAGQRADLSEANLCRANLCRANLFGADLSRANLSGANLSEAILSRADLSRANLSRANLSRANLFYADLSYANLYGASLSEANLSGANLYGAELSGTILENRPVLSFRLNRHTAQYFGDGVLQIGCHKHSLAQWVRRYKTIGKINEYTPKEIKAYGDFIKYCIKLTPKKTKVKRRKK